MGSRWDRIRRTPGFTFASALVLWVAISHCIQHEAWSNSVVSGVVFAALMTSTFEVLKRRSRP